MKRVKLFLTSIVVLTIVGGALAFTQKTYSVRYCVPTTPNLIPKQLGTTGPVGSCPVPILDGTEINNQAYWVTPIPPNVDPNVYCPQQKCPAQFFTFQI